MINQQDIPDQNIRASTAQGKRLVSKNNDYLVPANKEEKHLRQYSNSYLRSQLESLNQLEQTEEQKNGIVYTDLKESVSTGKIINPLVTTSGTDSIKKGGDMYSSREIPTRCDSAVKQTKKLGSTHKSSVFDNKASDWKFNMQEPMQMIMQYQNSSLNQTNAS